MKQVVDICPFTGLAWIDDEEILHRKGEGLSDDESERLDSYFAKFVSKPFDRTKAIELAQMALNNEPIPEGWKPKQ